MLRASSSLCSFGFVKNLAATAGAGIDASGDGVAGAPCGTVVTVAGAADFTAAGNSRPASFPDVTHPAVAATAQMATQFHRVVRSRLASPVVRLGWSGVWNTARIVRSASERDVNGAERVALRGGAHATP